MKFFGDIIWWLVVAMFVLKVFWGVGIPFWVILGLVALGIVALLLEHIK